MLSSRRRPPDARRPRPKLKRETLGAENISRDVRENPLSDPQSDPQRASRPHDECLFLDRGCPHGAVSRRSAPRGGRMRLAPAHALLGLRAEAALESPERGASGLRERACARRVLIRRGRRRERAPHVWVPH